MHPQEGDILVSRSSGNVEHQVGIVPGPPHESCATHDQAVERACALAKERDVDAWLTEDLTHFLRIATFRPAGATTTAREQRPEFPR
jgi:hypothetical protein